MYWSPSPTGVTALKAHIIACIVLLSTPFLLNLSAFGICQASLLDVAIYIYRYCWSLSITTMSAWLAVTCLSVRVWTVGPSAPSQHRCCCIFPNNRSRCSVHNIAACCIFCTVVESFTILHLGGVSDWLGGP